MLRRKTHPKTRKHTLCAVMSTCQKRHHKIHFRRTNASCQPAQSKRTSTCQKRHQKSHVIRKITGKSRAKRPRSRSGPERRRTLCASLRSRNACQEKFTGIMPQTRVSTLIKHRPLHLYRKTPPVWTHCLGKKRQMPQMPQMPIWTCGSHMKE